MNLPSISASGAVLILSTSDVLLSVDAKVSGLFYDVLFLHHHEVRTLFSSDLEAQKRKFADTVATLIGSLTRPDMFRSVVEYLGRRHARYGVQDDQYRFVGMALLATLGQVLGTRFTVEVEAAWCALYNAVEAGMQAGTKLERRAVIGG